METITSKGVDQFMIQFEGVRSILPESIIEKAKIALDQTDFPNRKTEACKYTQVGKITRGNFSFQPKNIKLPTEYENLSPRIVFVNGNLEESLSIITPKKEYEILKLSEVTDKKWTKDFLGKNLKIENEPFHCINSLLCQDGIAVHIPKNVTIDEPIYIVNILSGDNVMVANRNIIYAEQNSKAKIVQLYNSIDSNSSFNNSITEIFVGENAHLSISKVQSEEENNFHVNTEQVHQEKNSTFDINTYTLNGSLVRNNLNIHVEGENCVSNLNGVYITKDKQHVDNHTIVDHKTAHCESNELYKGVMDENSTGVFNGKVFVRKDAQKVNAFQSNKNVLLSNEATINSKPELEIYADDVKCSHGSTIGQMDEEAIFYLMARGISKNSARNMMVKAFIGEVIEKEKDDKVLTIINTITKERFGWEF